MTSQRELLFQYTELISFAFSSVCVSYNYKMEEEVQVCSHVGTLSSLFFMPLDIIEEKRGGLTERD